MTKAVAPVGERLKKPRRGVLLFFSGKEDMSFHIAVLVCSQIDRREQPQLLLPRILRFQQGRFVILVVGANERAVRDALETSPTRVVTNELWRDGIGSSISAGFNELNGIGDPAVGALILLVDQPLIPSEHLRQLCEAVAANRTAIAATRHPERHGSAGAHRLSRRTRAVLQSRPSGALRTTEPPDRWRSVGGDGRAS